MAFIKRFLNVWYYQWAFPAKMVSIAVLVLLLMIVVLGIKSCGKKETHIDQASVEKINSNNKAEREAELTRTIEKNQDVITTVDGRTTIAETNVVERDRLIDEKVKSADQAIQAAKQQGRDVTSEELECILIPNNCK